MKLQHVPLEQIIWNPWRDKHLYPISEDQLAGLRESIKDHGFFSSVKGRRRNGHVELGCGHARFEAARKAKLDTIPIFIDDLDDDAMLRLMTDENALQSGANPGAVMNEVAAITRRLIEGLLEGTIVPSSVAKAFENKHAIEVAQKRLRSASAERLPTGHNVIRAYLGQGNPDKSHRPERAVREAISALKQSGKYDDIVEEMVCKYPPPVDESKPANKTEVQTTKARAPKHRILDERTANQFPNDHQFHAFREAVTSSAAQKVIPVNQQLALAKSIMASAEGGTKKKQIAAPYIKMKVQTVIQEGLKKQREINKEDHERYLAEEREARIHEEVDLARRWLRSLLSSIAKLIDLAEEYPSHPKLGGFSEQLNKLIVPIQQFGKKLK